MAIVAVLDLLAQLPESTSYVHPVKLPVMVVLFAIWALFAQWVDKDTIAVNTYRGVWNLITMGTGVLAAALLLFLPLFLASVLAFVVINGVLMTLYVLHRNGLVSEEDRVCTPDHIKSVIQRGFGKKKKEVEEVKERVRITAADKKVVPIPEEEVERHQFRLTQDLLFDALWRRAKVIELAPAGQTTKVTYLIDGIPTEREALARLDGDGVRTFMKRIAGLNLEERRKPQESRITVAMGGSKDRLLVVVRTGGSTAGEKLILRVLGEETRYKVTDLGFTGKQYETVRAIMDAQRGLAVLSAPRACGLTTTIYSFTRSHDAFLQNIQTLEYKKELEIDNVTQHVYQQSDDKTFFGELQKLVRSDPNVVVLPEVRDRESALAAANGAAKKQVVYVGLVGADVFEALGKWMALIGDAKLVAGSLLAVINQRLVRVLCSECKQPYKPDAQMLRKINMPADKVLYRPPEAQYDKHGNPILCQVCQGTGYVGRTGVFNILTMDDGLRQVIKAGGSLRDIQAYAAKTGMQGLQQQALQKVFDGITSIPEVVRVTRAPSAGKSAR
jgi:type II secretory ATPase GspE/PulE/Tfp pilus assembly ATPase PilB-like protein